MEHSLILDHVSKRFGEFTAVDNLSLEIPQGSIYGFLGPNGAGKTTTIRMVMSIFYPDEGTISVLGHPNAEEIKDRLGYLPEEKGLYKKMKTGEIVAYFGTLKGIPRAEAKRRATDLLVEYGLGDWIDKKCETLSKGMGQKVQLLSTLIHNPDLVILDEPFSGLDPVNMELMRNTILQMKRQGRTVIFSTHVMAQAEEICDFIFLINKGKKVLDGPLAEIRSAGELGIKIDYDGDGSILSQIPGLERINDSGKSAEVFLHPGTDPQAVLAHLVGKLRIRRFDLREPSLHEIFVRSVGGDVDE
ncbi:MAG: ATP-binding cassette domain-containing protein [Planctomycetota bacterium]|jgi:ABC-2 type transport system ATP-binding protein|nr:ATP-binding cassette domain-containing protein [Planctomycetota bacterium]